ncbi:MAG: alpha-N-arabinofuranosidase [Anaerolineaceae bacterium]|nr:alpha-N-arabinofuranosidase [Anaerolineaceae bacterium]
MAKVTINLADRIGTINPNIYGHFAEHLGRCIYDGIWVGEESSIPNTNGFRNDVIEHLRRMKPPVIRWPGGCFADDYHWQDGIGPRGDRPRRINIHWGEVVESNHVGTHEFIEFCRLVDAEPYFCGNLGSGTVREMRDWVEYCNFDGDSTYAAQRAENGSPKPFNVTFWGVGNENWGCGGNFSPEDYCTEFRRYASFMRGFGGKKLYLIACGPSGNDVKWTNRFFNKLMNDYWAFNNIHGFAAHYYCGTAGTATEYTENQWYHLIDNGLKMEDLVVQQRAAMDTFDPQRRIGLIVDEWGTWHPVEEGTNPRFLYQQNTLRDAMVAATTLDIFNRHADKVVMANIAQMVNVLQAMILTKDEHMLVTPTGYVYELYAPHQGGESVRVLVDTPSIPYERAAGEAAVPMVGGSASLKGKTLFLTLTNAHASEDETVELELLGGSQAVSASARMMCGEIHAHNTFEAPEQVSPVSARVEINGGKVSLTLPPASVTAVSIDLA